MRPRPHSLLPCVAVLAALAGLAGCRSESAAPPPVAPARSPGANFPVTLTDARGKTLTLQKPPQHIVSIAPSNTEILFALGAGPQIAADTTACDYPPEAKTKPHIGGYPINIENVEAKNPDLVVAVQSINAKPIQALEALHTPVLAVDPKTVNDAYDALRLLGKATGHSSEADKIVAGMQTRIQAVRDKTARATTKPKVLIAYGDNPIYTTGPGSFIDDLIAVAGGVNIVSSSLPGNVITSVQVLARQPDVIICSPALQARLKQLPGWAQGVPAIRNNRFFQPSQEGILELPGPRLPQAAEELARYLHPELFAKNAPVH